MKIKRLHDDFYLKENRYDKPKECFKDLIKILKKQKKKNLRLCDVGCANGELIYNLEKKFPSWKITGADLKQDLLNKAKNKNKEATFVKLDISKNYLKNKFDIIVASGVLSIFDNQNKVLSNLIKMLEHKGSLFIFGHFNPYPINVYLKYQDLKNNKNILQSGWNIFALEFYKNFAKKNNLKFKIFPFDIKLDLKKNKKDPVRSWTFKTQNNKRLITNGLSIIQYQHWILMKKK